MRDGRAGLGHPPWQAGGGGGQVSARGSRGGFLKGSEHAEGGCPDELGDYSTRRPCRIVSMRSRIKNASTRTRRAGPTISRKRTAFARRGPGLGAFGMGISNSYRTLAGGDT